MAPYWLALADNVIALLVTLPILGAGLILLVKTHASLARDLAWANVTASIALCFVLLAHFEQDSAHHVGSHSRVDRGYPHIQMETRLRWLGSGRRGPSADASSPTSTTSQVPNITVSVCVDGISLWPIVLTVFLTAIALASHRPTMRQNAVRFYVLVLAFEAAMIGLFAADDVILFCVFLETSLIPIVLLVGYEGDHARRRAARQLLTHGLVAGGLVLLGLLGVVFAVYWTQSGRGIIRAFPLMRISGLAAAVNEILQYHNEWDAWHSASLWAFALLLLGFALHTPMIPWHRWYVLANSEASAPVATLLSGLRSTIGIYGVVRFLVPLFPGACQLFASPIAVVIALSLCGSALRAYGETETRRKLTYACMWHVNLAFLGVFSLNHVGITGSMYHMLTLAVAAAAVFQFWPSHADVNYPQSGSIPVTDGNRPEPRRWHVLSLLTLIGLPGLSVFVSALFVVYGVFAIDPSYSVWGPEIACVVLLCAVLLGTAFLTDLFGTRVKGQCSVRTPAGKKVSRVSCVLIVTIVTLGVAPRFCMDRMQPSIAALLRHYYDVPEATQPDVTPTRR